MNFFDRLGKVLAQNLVYTIILAVSVILFLYFAGGDLIAGLLTALSALVAYISVVLLYREYKAMPKTTTVKTVVKKTSVKKPTKKSRK